MLRRALLAGAFIALAAIGALAQSVVQDNLSGNEAWQAGQTPGGPGSYLITDLVRNSAQKVPITPAGAATLGVTTGYTALRRGGNLIITAQPAAGTYTLPPNPVPDGAIIGVCNPTAGAFATNVTTLAPNTNQTLTGGNITLTTLASVTCVRVQFHRATTTWYRLQ